MDAPSVLGSPDIVKGHGGVRRADGLGSTQCVPRNPTADSRESLDPLGPLPRAEPLHVLLLPDPSEPTGSASSGATGGSRLRRSAYRLRGGSDAPSGARRDAGEADRGQASRVTASFSG
jgi:hypothetical protein